MTTCFVRVPCGIETWRDPEELAARIASDQSTSTFTDLPRDTAAAVRMLREARVA
jgi:hypothetical protein